MDASLTNDMSVWLLDLWICRSMRWSCVIWNDVPEKVKLASLHAEIQPYQQKFEILQWNWEVNNSWRLIKFYVHYGYESVVGGLQLTSLKLFILDYYLPLQYLHQHNPLTVTLISFSNISQIVKIWCWTTMLQLFPSSLVCRF